MVKAKHYNGPEIITTPDSWNERKNKATYVERYKCPYCGTKGVTKEEINQHMVSSHPMLHGFENKLPKIVRSKVNSKWDDDSPPRKYYERRR